MSQLKVLLTLDLPDNVSDEKRKDFYNSLKNADWHKMGHITTAWRCCFKESISYNEAYNIVISDLKQAKDDSGVEEVSYNFLISQNSIQSGTI